MINIYGDKAKGIEYNILYTKYKDTILQLHKDTWDDEDINGWSCKHKVTTLWYLSFLVAMLFKSDVERGFYKTSVLISKYNLSALNVCLNCAKIPFLEILNTISVNLNITEIEGINNLGIETNMWIEHNKCVTNSPNKKECSINLNTIAVNSCCEVLLTNECKPLNNGCGC